MVHCTVLTLAVYVSCSGSVFATKSGGHLNLPQATEWIWPFQGMLRKKGGRFPFKPRQLPAGVGVVPIGMIPSWPQTPMISTGAIPGSVQQAPAIPTGVVHGSVQQSPAIPTGGIPASVPQTSGAIPTLPSGQIPDIVSIPAESSVYIPTKKRPQYEKMIKELDENTHQVHADSILLSKLEAERGELKRTNDELIEKKKKKMANHKWLVEAVEAAGMNRKELLSLQSQKKMKDDKLAHAKSNYETQTRTLAEIVEGNKKIEAAIETNSAEKAKLEEETRMSSLGNEQLQKDIEETQNKLMGVFQDLDATKQDLVQNYKKITEENQKMGEDVEKDERQSQQLVARKIQLQNELSKLSNEKNSLQQGSLALSNENTQLVDVNKKLKTSLGSVKHIVKTT